jgi:hypothetical protein
MLGYEKEYKVSTLGRLMRIGRNRGARVGRISLGGKTDKGYLLCHPRKGLDVLVHRAVLNTFLGPQPEMQARHLNGVKSDNRLRNLAWGTNAENQADRVIHGTSNRGHRHPLVKLTKEQVREARHSFPKNSRLTGIKCLAEKWGVSTAALREAIQGKTWAWLSDER